MQAVTLTVRESQHRLAAGKEEEPQRHSPEAAMAGLQCKGLSILGAAAPVDVSALALKA